jgi:two-component system OmpR family response regulator
MVDDDPGIRSLCEIAFRNVGTLTACIVESGRKALEVITDFRPDVILLDVMMPDIDGQALFEMLKKDGLCAKIPVIFITAKVQKHEVQSYQNLGAAGVIIKPFDPVTLPRQIESLVRAHQTLSTRE